MEPLIFLHITLTIQAFRFNLFEDIISSTVLLQSRKNLFFIFSFTSFILLLSSLFAHNITSCFYEQFPELGVYENQIKIVYLAASLLAQFISIGIFNAISKISNEIHQQGEIIETGSIPTIYFTFSTFKLSMIFSLV